MRKIVAFCTCVLALALPAASQALVSAPGDGSLVVEEGRGAVSVVVRGGIIGRFDQGRVYIETPGGTESAGPIVYGAETVTQVTPTKTLYVGFDVRFRVIGGFFRVKVIAEGINISAVGKGYVTLNGGGFIDAGTFSLNGDDFQAMPVVPTTFKLGTG